MVWRFCASFELDATLLAGTATGPGGALAAGAGPSDPVLVDNTPPEVRIAPAGPLAPSPGDVTFTVTFTGASTIALEAADVFVDVDPFGVDCAATGVMGGDIARQRFGFGIEGGQRRMRVARKLAFPLAVVGEARLLGCQILEPLARGALLSL